MLNENALLDIARGEVVVVIQADFSDADNLGMRGQIPKAAGRIRVERSRFVRMYTHGAKDAVVSIQKPEGSINGHHCRYAGFPGPLDDCIAVAFERFVIEMTV